MMHFPFINKLLRMNDLYFMIILYLEKDVYSFESSGKSSGYLYEMVFFQSPDIILS